MKSINIKTVICVAILAVFLSCCGQSEQLAKNKDIAIQANDAINAKDYDKIRELYADNFVRHCQATPDAEINDVDSFIGLVQGWMKSFPDAHQTIHLMAAEDDLVAFFVSFEGTQDGPMEGILATGKKMVSDCYGFHRIENGKIAETWVTWDNLSVLTQLGIFPPPEAKETKE